VECLSSYRREGCQGINGGSVWDRIDNREFGARIFY
jgi:hypothetical protein